VMCEGAVAQLEDFELLNLTRGMKTEQLKMAKDKGHTRQFALTIEAMKSGREAPIRFEEIVEVTATTFAILKSISTGETVAAILTDPVSAPAEMAVSSSGDGSSGD
jgi:hypothetical protein